MNLSECWRYYVPIGIRYKIAQLRKKTQNSALMKKLEQDRQLGKLNDYAKEYEYIMGGGGGKTFPYAWGEKYDWRKVDVYYDYEKKMRYVIFDDKKLYFPRKYSKNFIKHLYISLLQEQDDHSPHQYNIGQFIERDKEYILFDIGAAEGMITLGLIEQVKRAVLVECDLAWIQALEATFASYKDKIEIVPLFAGAVDTENTISLKTCYEKYVQRENAIFKLDIEGAEEDVLSNALGVLKQSYCSWFVCTYHKPSSYEDIRKIFEDYNYKICDTEGVMLFGSKDDVGFRKGMIKAWR